MRAAAAVLLGASVFFTGVLFGSAGRAVGTPVPGPVVLEATTTGGTEGSGRPEGRNAPAPEDLDIEAVERQVQEGSVEDYGDGEHKDEGDGDNSGPGSDSSGSGSSGSSGSDGSGD